MYYIDWGLFALGLLIGIVGTVTAMLAVVSIEYRDEEPATSNEQLSTSNEERVHA